MSSLYVDSSFLANPGDLVMGILMDGTFTMLGDIFHSQEKDREIWKQVKPVRPRKDQLQVGCPRAVAGLPGAHHRFSG
jgi:hypothetical protein